MLQRVHSLINPQECFFSIESHAALDINPGLGDNILLLQFIPELRPLQIYFFMVAQENVLASQKNVL